MGARAPLTSHTPSCGSPDQLIRSIVYVATMRRRVICIARLLGAGSADVGRTVAARLGYTFVDEEIGVIQFGSSPLLWPMLRPRGGG